MAHSGESPLIANDCQHDDAPSSGGLQLGNGGSSTRITELFAEPAEADHDDGDDDDDDFDVPSFLK